MISGAAIVVLTHRRPGLATRSVARLLADEGIDASRLVLVVNGEGGLDDPTLERRLELIRLPENLGPAGGFEAGLRAAVDRLGADWVYLCEDDICLFDLPPGRVRRLIDAVAERERAGEAPVGAVVAFARDLDDGSGLTVPHRPVAEKGLEPVDVAAWGATLVSRRVVDAGVLPDPSWFFGYEDFDFFLRIRRAGFEVLLDVETAIAVEDQVTDEGRAEAFAGKRPNDAEEPWRAYYQARNFLELRRRHGSARWTRQHLVKSVRRFQLTSGAGRVAVLRGLADGFRGRLGQRPEYLRSVGER